LTTCFFVSDLHGRIERYRKLFDRIASENPQIVFMGGDLLPSGMMAAVSGSNEPPDFIDGFLTPELVKLKDRLGDNYPRIMVILGNDDPRSEEEVILELSANGLIEYIDNRRTSMGEFDLYGYACVPPTPFRLKDRERYDVSRYTDPGRISPEEGVRTAPLPDGNPRYVTIQKDLEILTEGRNLEKSVFLFHAPPYDTNLDRAALDGMMVEGVPVDVHIGSIAVKRLILARQPLVTMHGHVHESSGLTGKWRDKIGRTNCYNAAYDGSELALIRFTLEEPDKAVRELI